MSPRPRRRKNKCLSCRKLKIKCDEARPICEYCEDTGRECVYDDNLSPGSDSSLTSSEAVVWRNQSTLNALPWQLGVTDFEFRLLRYFHEIIVPKKMANDAVRRLWLVQVPQLFQISTLVRNSLLSLSAVSVRGLCDLSSWVEISEVDDDARGMALTAMGESPNSKEHLRQLTDLYYMQTISNMSKIMGELSLGSRQISSPEEAAELLFSGSMFFVFLALQSNDILPLLSFDRSEPDLVLICQGVKETATICYPMLVGTEYAVLFQFEEITKLPEIRSYPLIEHLRNQAKQLNGNGFVTDHELVHYNFSLEMLELLFAVAATQSSTMILYRWLFLLDNEVYNFIREDRAYFSLKLLYTYCCLNIFCKFYTSRRANIWMQFIEWYKLYNFETGGWRDPLDGRLYLMVHSDYLFPFENLKMLDTFLPE